jgi:CHAT domain-containing protein
MHVQQSLKSLSELYSKLWVPLQTSLGPADKVLLSPDGVLNLVPFAALMDRNGKPLVERYKLAYVSSGRELIAAAGTANQPQSDLVLVANPAFDLKPESAFTRADDRRSFRSRDFYGTFAALPATEREAKEIPPLVAGDEKRKQVVVGAKATESAVKAARSPRILHLATHGFFLQDEELQPDLDTRGGFLRPSFPVERRGPSRRYENPLLRSGLALAGANNAAQVTEGDDGLLTALEITGMDLYGTDLVVLSACETALGEVKTGEGVFGLRRAFALAGAKNLLMSLWPVNDETTANQMKAFYQNLQTLPPAEALRQAQLETITELKADYGGIAPPALWAPFILQGAQALGR